MNMVSKRLQEFPSLKYDFEVISSWICLLTTICKLAFCGIQSFGLSCNFPLWNGMGLASYLCTTLSCNLINLRWRQNKLLRTTYIKLSGQNFSQLTVREKKTYKYLYALTLTNQARKSQLLGLLKVSEFATKPDQPGLSSLIRLDVVIERT